MVFADYVESYFPSMKMMLIFFFVVYIPLYIVSVTFFRRRIRKTPFALPSLISRTHKKLITDQRSRDAMLRQHFNLKRIPENVDVIIVGSNLGGMVTAGLLARSGVKVLVLERHSVIGGKIMEPDMLNEYAFELDNHFGNMEDNSILRLCLDQVTSGGLDWNEITPNFDEIYICKNERRKRLSVGKNGFQSMLQNEFPDEISAIKRYFELLNDVQRSLWHVIWIKILPLPIIRLLRKIKIFESLSNFFILSKRSLYEVLDELTSNEELKNVLAYYSYTFCESPASLPFVSFAFRFNQLLNDGAFYPVGGLSEIMFNIVPQIESAKGKVLVGASVDSLIYNEKRVTGVRVSVGENSYDIPARCVIIAEGICKAKELFPEKFHKKNEWITSIEPVLNQEINVKMQVWLDNSESLSTLKSQNVYLFNSRNKNLRHAFEDWLKLSPMEANKQVPPCVMLSFPSVKDPKWKDRFTSGSSLVSVNFKGSVKWVGELSKNCETRKRFFQTIWADVCLLYPHLEEVVVKSVNFHINDDTHWTEHVSRYSLQMQSNLRPDCGMKSFLLTGGDIFIGGYIGEVYSAILCASYFLNRNLMSELMQMKKGVESGKV